MPFQVEPGAQGRRRAAWAFALLAHALIIWALLQDASPLPRQRAAIERMTLVYLPPPDRAAPATALPPHPQPTPPPLAAQRPSRTTTYAAPAAPGETAPAPAPSQQPQPPAIDWAAEQDRVAESQARAHWTELSQHCRDAAALHIYPPECHRYIEPKPWEPEEKRFGMAGPLPYVRAGPCVVGLGFWGCAVGKAPPPDSHVFDGMRDPDRPNPIPDNGSYQPPATAREPLH